MVSSSNFLPIKEKLSKWNLLYVEGRVGDQEYSSFFSQNKKFLKYRVRESCDKEWSFELCSIAKMDVRNNFEIHKDVSKVLVDIPQLNSTAHLENDFFLTFGHAHNVITSSCAALYLSSSICNNTSSLRNVCSYSNISLSNHLQKTITLFRLSAAPLCRNIQYETCISNRICKFCDIYFSKRHVEDEYHVCFECPLYDNLRTDFYINLSHAKFDFSKKCSQPIYLLSSILSVSKPKHVRLLGEFLYKCLALRSIYASNEVDNFWTRFLSTDDRKKLDKYSKNIDNCEVAFIFKSHFIFQNKFSITLDEPRILTDFVSKNPLL